MLSVYYRHLATGAHSRRFYMSNQYGGCTDDRAWFVVLDADHGTACDWENFISPNLPTFLYSATTVNVKCPGLLFIKQFLSGLIVNIILRIVLSISS